MFSKIEIFVVLVVFGRVYCKVEYGVPFSTGDGGRNYGGYENVGQDHGKTAFSSYGSPNPGANRDHHEYTEPKSYEFGYQVKDDYTGTNYNRQEQSDGNQVTGSYRVALPDGRIQIVTYYADWKTGFHADVRYEGEAKYPDQYQNNNNGYPNSGNNNGNNNYNLNNVNNAPFNQYGIAVNPIAINSEYAGPTTNTFGSVSIKDYSNSELDYNNYDSYANIGGNKAKPSSTYGTP